MHNCDEIVTHLDRFDDFYNDLRESMDVTVMRLTGWICNGNQNLQHFVDDRQLDFQACSFNHSDISPLAAGPHPRRELTLMPRLGLQVLSSAWPQALLRTTTIAGVESTV